MRKLLLSAACATLIASAARAQQTTVPKADRPGSKDHPLLRRYEGSLIVAYEQKAFDEFTLALSRLEPVAGKRDSRNNHYYEPTQKKPLEGPHTRLVYLLPPGRSPLEVIRNYQQEVQGKGGKILFECKGEECGGSATRSSGGGGGKMSLAMYLYPESHVKDPHYAAGWCVQIMRITDQRYLSAEIPPAGTHVSVLTYTLNDKTWCEPLNERNIVVVDIIEGKAREQKMVTVKAEDMAQQISSAGSVSLYGIYFDFNKADVKSASTPALDEVSRLLKSNAKLKLLVVGHTDNAGGFTFNMDLSQRRAAAVVDALVTRYRIDRGRLSAVGVSFASPVASNKTEEGRARNRRVQLVEN
jgi:outer membrane protein OmpA-like peptidoglycan-associated protein